MRKIILILIVNFLNSNITSEVLLVLLILIISIYLQIINNPFIDKKMNFLELFSCFSALITIYLGFLHFIIQTEFFKVSLQVFILIFNICFFIFCLSNVFPKTFLYVISRLKKMFFNFKKSKMLHVTRNKSKIVKKNDKLNKVFSAKKDNFLK